MLFKSQVSVVLVLLLVSLMLMGTSAYTSLKQIVKSKQLLKMTPLNNYSENEDMKKSSVDHKDNLPMPKVNKGMENKNKSDIQKISKMMNVLRKVSKLT